MKSSKSMAHSELVRETQRLVAPRFQASAREVKRVVEDLIAREYLERDAADGERLVYLS